MQVPRHCYNRASRAGVGMHPKPATFIAIEMPQSPSRLDDILAEKLVGRESRNQRRRLTTVPPGTADFSSNAYLSLSTTPEIQSEFLARLQGQISTPARESKTAILGSGGSRLLDGNSTFAESLEQQIASFHRASAGLLFNSAFDANIGLFSCVPQPGDVIIYDELIHASVHDGMRLSRAKTKVAFAHNHVRRSRAQSESSAAANPARKCLHETLKDIAGGEDGREVRDGRRNIFIAVEALYSMDGDVAPLAEIVRCVEESLPAGNGYIIVDEAHSTGIFGDQGRGLVCQLGLEDRVWARVHGFGKAMSCAGGIVLSSVTTRDYLINYARSLIYTTSMAFLSLASIATTYDFLISGRADRLISHLYSLINHTQKLLLSICSIHRPPEAVLRLITEVPKSPIIPLLTSHPRSLAQYCQSRGYMVRPIVAPTVPVGSERVRICLHAGNTVEEVEGLCLAIEEWTVRQMERGMGQLTGRISGEEPPRSGRRDNKDVVEKAKL